MGKEGVHELGAWAQITKIHYGYLTSGASVLDRRKWVALGYTATSSR
jgi:hypothetical protein